MRLRAASQQADLELDRPVIEDGRLKARGTISDRARGVVRLQLQYVVDGETKTLPLRGQIDDGEWEIDEELSEEVLGEMARRTGSVHSYTLFTGYFEAAHSRRDAVLPGARKPLSRHGAHVR